MRSAHRAEGLPGNELLINLVAQREPLLKPIADCARCNEKRVASRRAASRCIASDRIAAMRRRYLENGDLRAPEIARARTFLRCSAPLDFARGNEAGRPGERARTRMCERRSGEERVRFDPELYAHRLVSCEKGGKKKKGN